MNTERQPGLVKLKGVIANYNVTRSQASFVFTDIDRNAMGVVAVAATIVGLSGPAIATAANATSTEEEADYLEFDLAGQPVKGWVWRSPFEEGDLVEVVAEWQGDHYEAAAIARPADRVIALYPHCSRGKISHIRNSAKWWFLGSTLINAFGLFLSLFVVSFSLDRLLDGYPYMALGFYFFFGLMTFSLARRWMPFVRLAQRVFVTLGWPKPANVDLVRSTKAQGKPNDPGELGTFYFRY